MSIQFKCPNGHDLKVKEKYAGQMGLCPKCQVRVLVPAPAPVMNDDAIMDLLGPPPTEDPESLPVHQDARHRNPALVDTASMSGSSLLGMPLLSRGTKTCPKCKRDVRSSYDICPHCRTYFTDVTEVNRRMTSTCKVCGGETQLHDVNCPTCGADMRLH